jgi:hypothetical protein
MVKVILLFALIVVRCTLISVSGVVSSGDSLQYVAVLSRVDFAP